MMIEPPPPCFILGRQYLVQSMVVVRLASSTLCQSADVTVSGVPGAPMPTLLCRMSSRPYFLTAKSAIASAASGLATSPANTAASPPSSLICLASLSARSALRLTSTTLAPSRANRMAVAMPLPTPSPRGAAPVTTATLPFRRPAMFFLPAQNAISGADLSRETRAMASKTETFEGGCTCRHVRYRLTSKAMFVHCCHCRWCQRETGTAFALNAIIESDRVELLAGTPEAVDTPSNSGRGQKIWRCPSCRIALWSNYGGGGDKVRFIRVGTLLEPDRLPPDIHIYTMSKQSWVVLPEGTPAVAEYYDSSKYWPTESLVRRAAVL